MTAASVFSVNRWKFTRPHKTAGQHFSRRHTVRLCKPFGVPQDSALGPFVGYTRLSPIIHPNLYYWQGTVWQSLLQKTAEDFFLS